MDVLLAPLEPGDIDRIRQRFPNAASAELPAEAHYWRESDIERYFATNGKVTPDSNSAPRKSRTKACTLLSRIRLQLAEEKINKATPEYLSYCWHVRENWQTPCKLSGIASCTPVKRVKQAPDTLSTPVTISPQSDEDARTRAISAWTLDFWRRAHGDERWMCRARAPPFEGVRAGADSLALPASIEEYSEYAKQLEEEDPDCLEENALGFPRVQIHGWAPFGSCARSEFLAVRGDLNPPGLQDLTPRWVRMFAGLCNADFTEYLAWFYRISISAPGCVTRLHKENNNCHMWFTQVEGTKAFFVFPPEEVDKLYEERGELVDAPDGCARSASAVDVFAPSARRHPSFAGAKGYVSNLRPGDTLVLPADWWWCSAARESCVTLSHKFWDMQNRVKIVDELWDSFSQEDMPAAVLERYAEKFAELREDISMDSGSDTTGDCVDGGGSRATAGYVGYQRPVGNQDEQA